MSTYVAPSLQMSRLKKNLLCRFCQCAFACVDSFRGSISGCGRLFATLTEARCTPVTRLLGRGMLCLGVFGRFMSGHVGSSRRKSGQSGCFSFFSGHCCRCAFACVDPFVGSISGMSRFTYIIPQNSCLFGDNFPDGSASGLFPLYPFSVPFFSVAHCSMCDLHFGRRLLSEL